MKTQQDMRDWLKVNKTRAIKPLLHCSGWRVDLLQDFYEVSTGVGATIEEAFTDAERSFAGALKIKMQQVLASTIEQRDRNIKYENERVERIEKTIRESDAATS